MSLRRWPAALSLLLLSMSLWLLLSGDCLAQGPPPGKPPVRSYMMAEYGGHLTNWVVRQAPDQRIVVGGGDGVVIFDGAHWQTIPSRHRNRIRTLEIDPEGRIWAGSSDEFGVFEPGDDGGLVYRSLSDELPEDQRSFADVRGVHLIDDAVYFHTLRQLFRWRDGELTVARSGDDLFRITVSHRGRLLALIGDRFYDYTDFPFEDGGSDSNSDSAARPEPEAGWRLPEGPRLSMLASWPDGRLLMGSVDNGLFWLSDAEPEAVETDFDFADAWLYRAIPAPDGGMLVASVGAGLFHLGPQGEALEQVTHRNGLDVNDINDLVLDHENGVWLAQGGAIARVDLFSGRRSYDADFGLSNTHALVRFQDHWLVGGDAGLGVLAADGPDASRLLNVEAPLLEVFEILDDGDGVLVASSGGVHRLVLDLDSRSLLRQETLIDDSYSFGLVRSRLREAVYAELDSGLGVLVRDGGAWRSLGRIEGVRHRANTVVEDQQGRVWVGTTVGRYYRLAWEEDELVLEAVLDADDGVPEGYAWAFDPGGRLVLGTGKGGYRPAGPEGLRVEPDPGFGNDRLGEPRGVYRLYHAGDGQLVAGIGPGGALWRGTLEQDGDFAWQGRWLTDLPPAVNWFIGERGEHLWIGRYPGLIRVDWPPAETEAEVARLQVQRAGFPDRDQWLVAGPGAGPLADPLAASPQSLRFEYALTSYRAPERTEYRVRLDGLEPDWSRWSKETRRDYTNLPGGKYRLRIQARDAAGRRFESDTLAFRVEPPLHRSAVAWTLYVVAALLLLGLAARGVQRRREQRLRDRQHELERAVADRTTEVRRQAREIRTMSDARADFFANVSHELRTPLTLTRAPLEELARGGDNLTEPQRAHLDLALRNTEAMQSLVGQVLDLNRLDADSMPFAPVRADLAAAVVTLVKPFAVPAAAREVDLRLTGVDAPISAAFDPNHLATIVTNLVSNALKFAPRGSRVHVDVTATDGGHVIEVIDAGPGVAVEDRERIFERYQQADGSPRGGTGIGLALVRELVALHDGRVDVGEASGGGARFRVFLPERPDIVEGRPVAGSGLWTMPPRGETDQQATDRDAMPTAVATDDTPTVLIVDDNAELRGFLRLRLGRAYRMIEAGDGQEGLEKARKALPDAIITDGMMPDLDGLAMTSALKSDPETDYIPVLMLTARGGPDAVVRGMQAGADDYLAKPFDSAELAARVAGLIASRRRLRERLAAPSAPSGGAPEPDAGQPNNPFLTRAREILAEHYDEPGFTVRDWADLLHMDRTTLYRKFKAAAGQSPDEELRERRLHRAAELLRAGAGNVAEVADAVGFASVSAFSRRFRERFDATPAAFARNDAG